jgi:hypothetical protein
MKMKLLNLINRTLNNTFYKNLISGFFKEVVDDIDILNDDLYNNINPFVNYICKDYELITKVKDITSKRYKEEYCPTKLYNYFNKSEKVNYLILRNKIDKILGIKSIHYKI